MSNDDDRPPVQTIHITDKKGRSLLSIYVRHDDSFQVADERGGTRRVVIDTKDEKSQAAAAKLEAFT